MKSLENDGLPPAGMTRPVIRRGVLDALRTCDEATGIDLKLPSRFTLTPTDPYVFNPARKRPPRQLTQPFFFLFHGGQLAPHGASWEVDESPRASHAPLRASS